MPKEGTRIREKLTLSRKIELMNDDRKKLKRHHFQRHSMINNSIVPLVPAQVLPQTDNSVSTQQKKLRMMGPPGISSTFIGHIATLADMDEPENKCSNNMGMSLGDVSLPSTVVVTTSNGPPFFNMNSKESILAGIQQNNNMKALNS